MRKQGSLYFTITNHIYYRGLSILSLYLLSLLTLALARCSCQCPEHLELVARLRDNRLELWHRRSVRTRLVACDCRLCTCSRRLHLDFECHLWLLLLLWGCWSTAGVLHHVPEPRLTLLVVNLRCLTCVQLVDELLCLRVDARVADPSRHVLLRVVIEPKHLHLADVAPVQLLEHPEHTALGRVLVLTPVQERDEHLVDHLILLLLLLCCCCCCCR
jgi:hypothetical protein